MAVQGAELWLVVDDAAAAYPVTIGPTFVPQQKLTASEGVAGFSFRSVAISGATIAAGAPGEDFDRGSVYVFERRGGSFVEQQKHTASHRTAHALFGFSVAIHGATIVIGAAGEDSFQGPAYVFECPGRSFVEHQKLTASDETTSKIFGVSVAISGGRSSLGHLGTTLATPSIKARPMCLSARAGPLSSSRSSRARMRRRSPSSVSQSPSAGRRSSSGQLRTTISEALRMCLRAMGGTSLSSRS
jgi:hypothetical protein